MKIYVHASEDIKEVRYSFKVPRTNRTYRFTGKLDKSKGYIWGDIQRIAPYDDADYYWAKISGDGRFKIIHNGKVVDKVHIWAYEDGDYEEGVDQYLSDVVMEVAKELDVYNDKIQPRMMYN